MQALVIGAGGGIGSAVLAHWYHLGYQLSAVSRTQPEQPLDGVDYQICATEQQIADCCQRWRQQQRQFGLICIATGMLHDGSLQPEKALRQFDSANYLHSMQINAALPLLWLQGLQPLLEGSASCKIAILSARVGSINDNRLGGWYSYRASKAALNMLLQCAAIELYRRAPRCKLVAFHPGTTDTQLSAPFQHNVQPGKLFTPEFVAKRLTDVLCSQLADGRLSFVDYAGESIAW